jgi:hypothetical protein
VAYTSSFFLINQNLKQKQLPVSEGITAIETLTKDVPHPLALSGRINEQVAIPLALSGRIIEQVANLLARSSRIIE